MLTIGRRIIQSGSRIGVFIIIGLIGLFIGAALTSRQYQGLIADMRDREVHRVGVTALSYCFAMQGHERPVMDAIFSFDMAEASEITTGQPQQRSLAEIAAAVVAGVDLARGAQTAEKADSIGRVLDKLGCHATPDFTKIRKES